MPHLFLPFFASSQDCEGLFRLFRSLGTVFHTTVNFNVLEFLHKARRVAAVSQVEKLIDPKFFSFDKKQKKPSFVPKTLPSDEKLYGLIISALAQARIDHDSLGNNSDYDAPGLAITAAVEKLQRKPENRKKTGAIGDEAIHDDSGAEELAAFCDDAFDESLFRNAPKDDFNAPDAPRGFINVASTSGPKVMRKSTALWSLTKPTQHLSQDRQRRFIEARKKKKIKTNEIGVGQFIRVKHGIRRLVAQVLGFVALTGKKETLTITSCPVLPPKDSGKREIGLVLNFFSVNTEKQLTFQQSCKQPIDISNYIAHLKPSEIIFKC